MFLAISSNIGRSFLLPVSIIRTGVDIVNDFVRASAQKAHPLVRQSLTAAPLPGCIMTRGAGFARAGVNPAPTL